MNRFTETLTDSELLLLSFGDNELDYDCSDEFIDMISDFSDTDKSTLKIEIEKLIDEELVEEQTDDLIYRLTEKGKEKKDEIREEIRDKEVKLVDNEDTITLRLEDVRDILEEKSLIEIISSIYDGILEFSSKSYTSLSFVGRDDELNNLMRYLEKTIDGEGNTVFIKGDKGIGKTRLVSEIKEMTLEKDFDFIKGGSIVGDFNPYRPFKDALNKYSKLEDEEKDFNNIISRKSLINSSSKDKDMFEAQRKSIFYDTTKYVQKKSEIRPLVIFLDDLQWADKGTLNLLDYMSDRLQDKPVLFIGAYRPGDVPNKHPLNETMNRMSRKKLFDKIQLEPLDETGINELIMDMTGIEEVQDNFITNMRDKTKGNPLFIEESIKQMLNEGLIDKEESKFPDESEIVVTSDIVQDVISRRIRNLDDKTIKILQIGSVIGKKVPFEVLLESSEIDELELLDCIDSILESRLWMEHQDEESFIFYHDIFVETIYNGLGKWLERKYHHEKVARSMEYLFDDMRNRYSKLAYHYKNAERYDKACEYYHKAGKRAEEVYAHEDAIERYKESIKMANKSNSVDDEKKFEILENLSDALNIKGEYQDGRIYLKQAMSKTKDLEQQRRIYRKISKSFLNQGEYKESIDIIKKGLNLKGTRIDSSKEYEDMDKFVKTPETCRLLSEKGWVMMRLGKYNKAKKIFTEELELAKNLDHKPSLSQAYHDLGSPARSNIDPEKSIEYLNKSKDIRDELIKERNRIEDKLGKSRTLNNLGAIYSREGVLDKALDYFKKSLEIDEKTNIKLEKGRTLNNIGYLLILKGELEKASEYFEESKHISEKIGDKQGLSRLNNSRGILYKQIGDFDKSLEHLSRSLKIASEIDDIFGSFMSFKDIAKLYIHMGEMEKAEENIENAMEIADKIDNDKFRATILVIGGHMYRMKEEYDRAIEDHKKSLKISEEDEEKDDIFENRYQLSEDYVSKGDLDKAERYLEKAKEVNFGIIDMNNKIQVVEGILEREKGNLERAEEILESSLETSKELSKRYRTARLYYELSVLNRMDGEKESAENNLRKAENMFEEMGMKIYLDKCVEELDQIE